MAYSLITTPENSWHILNSDYNTIISSYLNPEFLDPTFLDQPSFNLEDTPGCVSPDNIENLTVDRDEIPYCNTIIRGMDADYIVIFVAAERFDIPDSNAFFYLLDGGADESKKHWFMKISNHQTSNFIESDGQTPTPYFMENSTLGKLIPFSIYTYAEQETNRVFDKYRHGLIPIYIKDVKYLDPENDPFYLVYASPSFFSDIPGPLTAVLVYKINPDYIP